MDEMKHPVTGSVGRKLAVVGIPYDERSSYLRGAAKAPPAVREALCCASSNQWSELGVCISSGETFTDLGDMPISTSGDPHRFIEGRVKSVLKDGFSLISLGGDHAITYPVVRAHAEIIGKIDLLDIDAHPDLYEAFEGDPLSHASPFCRIMEEGLVERLVQVGIRGMNAHQREQADRFGVEVVEMRSVRDLKDLQFSRPLYVSFDLDALDPAFAPGVSHPEPGGLSTREALHILHGLKGDVIGADIVELNPDRDPLGLTAMVAAKLLKEIAAKMLLTGRK